MNEIWGKWKVHRWYNILNIWTLSIYWRVLCDNENYYEWGLGFYWMEQNHVRYGYIVESFGRWPLLFFPVQHSFSTFLIRFFYSLSTYSFSEYLLSLYYTSDYSVCRRYSGDSHCQSPAFRNLPLWGMFWWNS